MKPFKCKFPTCEAGFWSPWSRTDHLIGHFLGRVDEKRFKAGVALILSSFGPVEVPISFEDVKP